jgi:hypothetical protein
MTATGFGPGRGWSRIRGAVGWLSSALLGIGGGGEGDRDRRGEGRREGTRGRLLWPQGDVSTVDSFDKGFRINGLIADVRVVLRIGVEGD